MPVEILLAGLIDGRDKRMEELFVPEGASITMTPVEGGTLINYQYLPVDDVERTDRDSSASELEGRNYTDRPNRVVVRVTNVTHLADPEDLLRLARKYGNVTKFKRTGGFTYDITYDTPKAALNAVIGLEGRKLGGHFIDTQLV